MENQESDFIKHTPCDGCGSSDANSLYSDGHTYCFNCKQYGQSQEEVSLKETKKYDDGGSFHSGEYVQLIKRNISERTCKFWDYQVGKKCQIANYTNEDGLVVAQKLRYPDKTFAIVGDMKKATLYGQHLWRNGGKNVTIVEGEIDALSMSQAFDNKWAVVSVKTGAAGAKKDIQKSIEWLEKFQNVTFMFDQDEVGKKAALECAALLSPRKAKIAKLPLKDANEMVVAGRQAELIDAFWSAKEFAPDGIINGEELWEEVSTEKETHTLPYPYQGINNKIGGCRLGEIVTVTAGSGLGKSQLTREFAYHLLNEGATIGYVALEESSKRTAQGLMSLHLGKPVHLEEVPTEELKEAFDATLGTGRVFMYDHWGSTESDNLLAKIRYLARGCGCQYIILDHISIVVSGIEGGDERRIIDNMMTNLRSLTEELNIGLIVVSHLRRPSGDKGHEEGQVTSLSQLRGSAAIAQLSDIVIGLERNQQDAETSNVTTVRILKNRWSGDTGVAGQLHYSTETGRMSEELDVPF
jgi:twinkle protein